MTKEEALQKVNDYCNEKSYTKETLTDGFKDKFAEHFAKRFKDVEPDDENAISDMQFALNTAFSGASSIITEQLDELKQFKTEEQKKAKYANVINIAKKGIRTDLHSSFEKFAKTVSVSIDKDDEEQAKEIVQTFQDIFKDSIGDIKPYTPKQVQQKEDEIINEVTKITL